MKNVFICCCRIQGVGKRTFEISERRNDFAELCEFFLNNNYLFVGYNCDGYDKPILSLLFSKRYDLLKGNYKEITLLAYELSHSIVVRGDIFIRYRYNNLKFFKTLDLMTMMASKALRTGLKSLQVTMCYPNVKEMVIDWSVNLEENLIDPVIHYCHNDIDSTAELLKLLMNDIILRKNIQSEFKIDCISKDGVGIGVDIFTDFVCDKLRCDPKQLKNYVELPQSVIVAQYIEPIIKFKTPQFQELLRWYKGLELSIDEIDDAFEDQKEPDNEDEIVETKKEKYKRTVILNNLAHTFALGGVHSVNKPSVYTADDEWEFIDQDVTSFYPSLALAYRWGPMGFLDAFLEVMQFLKDGRVIAKKTGDKLKNEVYKLALNSILGNLKNKYSPYYAPQANVAICVNGQLLIAMLIEEMELNGIECVSSNTDGATFKVHKSKKELFQKICDDWSKLTRMDLEDTHYEKMVIYAVNDYIAFKKGYSKIKDQIGFQSPYDAIRNPGGSKLAAEYVKEKGMFITVPRLGKGLDALIVPKALQNYFGKGISISETIKSATNIWDFMKFQKIGKQFDVVWLNEKQQHINRYYVSKKGGYLYKQKYKDKLDKKTGKIDKVLSSQNVLKGYGVQIINEYEDKPIADYNIQYEYYIRQANQILRKLEPEQILLF